MEKRNNGITLSEKFVPWGSAFIIVYAIWVVGFYVLGIISARTCEALCSLPCFTISVWYLIARFEERKLGRTNGTSASSVGWALLGVTFILPTSAWVLRVIFAFIGLCCIIAGCAIGFLCATRHVGTAEGIETIGDFSPNASGGKTQGETSGEGNGKTKGAPSGES